MNDDEQPVVVISHLTSEQTTSSAEWHIDIKRYRSGSTAYVSTKIHITPDVPEDVRQALITWLTPPSTEGDDSFGFKWDDIELCAGSIYRALHSDSGSWRLISAEDKERYRKGAVKALRMGRAISVG